MTKTDAKNFENRGLEGVWELLEATWGRKISLKLAWQILAGLGSSKIARKWAKLEPRWRQDAPSWGQDGHLEAIWGAILSTLGGLAGDL